MPRAAPRKAEKAASLYLEMRGFKILEQNWGLGKNKIDIIASKNDVVYFIELNYRPETPTTPASALTETQTEQRRAAVEAWVNDNKYSGQFVVASIDILGPELIVAGFNQGWL